MIKFTEKMIRSFNIHDKHIKQGKFFEQCDKNCDYYEIGASDTCGCRLLDNMTIDQMERFMKAYEIWKEKGKPQHETQC